METTIAIPINDVCSPDFVSMLDPAFKSGHDGSWKWPVGARSRPRLTELGALWDNKEIKKI